MSRRKLQPSARNSKRSIRWAGLCTFFGALPLLLPIPIRIAVGLALAAARLVQSTLYGVKFFSPATFASAILVLLGAAVLAALLPARRAARIDPLTALRYE